MRDKKKRAQMGTSVGGSTESSASPIAKMKKPLDPSNVDVSFPKSNRFKKIKMILKG